MKSLTFGLLVGLEEQLEDVTLDSLGNCDEHFINFVLTLQRWEQGGCVLFLSYSTRTRKQRKREWRVRSTHKQQEWVKEVEQKHNEEQSQQQKTDHSGDALFFIPSGLRRRIVLDNNFSFFTCTTWRLGSMLSSCFPSCTGAQSEIIQPPTSSADEENQRDGSAVGPTGTLRNPEELRLDMQLLYWGLICCRSGELDCNWVQSITE